MIGLAISTHNRYEVFKKTLAEIKKYTPKNFKLVIVDDASDEPVKEATFRFETNVGIAKTKNKCLELLDDCEHIFLFDDDCYPICKDWWKPYVESSEPHLCYTFVRYRNGREVGDSHVFFEDDRVVAYTHPRGCMLYYHHSVLEKVGGFNEAYAKWGYEHVDFSNRIYNNGMTTFRFQDVPNADKLIYSLDEKLEVKSTCDMTERRKYLQEMKNEYNNSINSKSYYPYKKPQKTGNRDIILTVYFTGVTDPQRNTKWEADYSSLDTLIKSVGDRELVILNDCFDEKDTNVKHVKVKTTINPYFQKWHEMFRYLRDNPDIRNVWCVDATDVELLKEPFEIINHRNLYLGTENEIVGCRWLVNNHPQAVIQSFIRRHRMLPLVNCGLVGGTRETVMNFIHDILSAYYDNNKNVGVFDMGIFNLVAYTKWRDRLVTGKEINTQFKRFEKDNKVAIWRHK